MTTLNGPVWLIFGPIGGILSCQDLENETHFRNSCGGFGTGLPSLGQGLLHRPCLPLGDLGGGFCMLLAAT